jgi:hypothetical protein
VGPGREFRRASAGGTLTSEGNFETRFNDALDIMLDANTDAKGIVANIPDVTSIPFFTTVSYKPIPLDAPTAASLQANLAGNYNAFLDGMVGAMVITQAEADKRYLTFIESTSTATYNTVLINDETLTDLSPYMAGPYAGLLKYAIARQTKSTDLVCLTAGSYIGASIDKAAPGDSILGVSFPIYNTSSANASALKGDDLILIPSEITEIKNAVTAFNVIISDAVTANSSRLALLDANTQLKAVRDADLSVTGSLTLYGIAIKASFVPPYGIFSVDGVHPNARGYAYIANLFISAINNKFNSRIPLCNPNDYPGNDLPIP